MDAPDVPRSRESSVYSSKKKFGSTLTSFIKQQYPHHASGKRESKLDERAPDRSGTSQSYHGSATSTSVHTAIHRGQHRLGSLSHGSIKSSVDGLSVHDFQDHHRQKPAELPAEPDHSNVPGVSGSDSELQPNSSDFSDFSDSGVLGDHDAEVHRYAPGQNLVGANHKTPPQKYDGRRTGSREVRGRQHSFTGADCSSPTTPEATPKRSYEVGDRSSAESVFSQETSATSIHTLPPLQTKGPDNSDVAHLEPLLEDDPRSFDLIAPGDERDVPTGVYALERRAEQLFSSDHLRIIFDDPRLLLKFTGFLNNHRPQSIPLLIYYLDALKAIRAINYANAVAEALEPIRGHDFTTQPVRPTSNNALEEKANKAFELLVRDDLPAYIAHTWIQVVSVSIQRRITGTLAPHLREASEGLAEVFCLTDPSRTDNPIVFASEEFTRTTQYGMGYVIGRNCRFLQGPRTNLNSVRRLAEACQKGKELTEVFVNYRRDGSPFMNLLMIAPLMDSRGNIRYYIGAQVDVSGLIKDCSELDGLAKMVEREQDPQRAAEEAEAAKKDEFQELSEMFNGAETEVVRKYGGRMHKEYVYETDSESISHGRKRILLKDLTSDQPDPDEIDETARRPSIPGTPQKDRINGKLEGVYSHYLLVRPAPSLRILFTSPSLRVPGILQSPFLNRIGGSQRVRSDLAGALSEGRGVTAKVRWLTRADEEGDGEGRPRWIHCTPLLGHSGAVGVWMVVLIDEEGSKDWVGRGRRFRQAPPVADRIGGKEWDGSKLQQASRSLERRAARSQYDKELDRRGGGAGREPMPMPMDARSGTSRAGSGQTGRQQAVPSRSGGGPRGPPPMSAGGQSVDASEFSFNIHG